MYNIEKSQQFIFSLQYEKTIKKEKRKKKFKRKKNKIRNILKEKKLKGKKLVVGILDDALLCAIHGAIVKNTLF